MSGWLILFLVVVAVLAAVTVYDLTQKRHAILRNFPVIGHLRYLLESVGPEVRQYLVADNDEERPFSRDQRRWVYATAKAENPYFGFGTDTDVGAEDHVIIEHSAFPLLDLTDHAPTVPAAKIIGARTNRPGAFRPASIVNVSAMSFGSLSGAAVEALNRGCAAAGCLHNTGEGGISVHHRQGGDLVYQIGTGYFGCRSDSGEFSMDALLRTIADTPVRAIEVKLSQGAKPGIGGLLPGAKVTAEIAAARAVPVGITVASPARHRAFDDTDGLIDFVERIAAETGLPVGIKSAVGQLDFWNDLSQRIAADGRGPDFVTIDGGEGGTGAGPLVFTDNVAYPFRTAFGKVYGRFVAADIHRDMTFIGAGKLGYPDNAIVAFALGCDVVNVAREAMLSIGCIQAQRCHTGHCPTGVATQSRWLSRGLDTTSKATRAAHYIEALRYEIVRVARAAGVCHPALIPDDAVVLTTASGHIPAVTRYGIPSGVERLHDDDADAIRALMEGC